MKKGKIIIGLGLVVVLAFIGACTPNAVEQLEGIIQNVDAANGEITIVTKDGQTRTFNIDTEVSVEAQGSPSTIDTLEVGASIQIEVNEDNQVVQSIKALQTEADTEENEEIEEDVEVGDEESIEENTADVSLSSDDVEEEDEAIADEQTISNDVDDVPGDSSDAQDDPDDGEPDVEVKPDIEPDVELTPDVEPSVDGEVVRSGNEDIIGDAVPGGDVDIDGDGKITIVDVVGGLEALRARLAEAIAENRISGYYDAEWIRNAEAERERLAEEIERALSDDTYIVVIDGKALIMDIDPIGDLPGLVIDDPPDGDHPDDDHPDDGDDHSDGGDDHSD